MSDLSDIYYSCLSSAPPWTLPLNLVLHRQNLGNLSVCDLRKVVQRKLNKTKLIEHILDHFNNEVFVE